MLTPEQMKMVRRFRIEGMIAGMALARSGDRDKILFNSSPGDFSSDVVVDILSGVREESPAIVKKALKRWGVEVSGTVCDSLLDMVREYGGAERARATLMRAMSSPDCNLKEVLENALKEIGE